MQDSRCHGAMYVYWHTEGFKVFNLDATYRTGLSASRLGQVLWVVNGLIIDPISKG
jgi:hypothetical protein